MGIVSRSGGVADANGHKLPVAQWVRESMELPKENIEAALADDYLDSWEYAMAEYVGSQAVPHPLALHGCHIIPLATPPGSSACRPVPLLLQTNLSKKRSACSFVRSVLLWTLWIQRIDML